MTLFFYEEGDGGGGELSEYHRNLYCQKISLLSYRVYEIDHSFASITSKLSPFSKTSRILNSYSLIIYCPVLSALWLHLPFCHLINSYSEVSFTGFGIVVVNISVFFPSQMFLWH